MQDIYTSGRNFISEAQSEDEVEDEVWIGLIKRLCKMYEELFNVKWYLFPCTVFTPQNMHALVDEIYKNVRHKTRDNPPPCVAVVSSDIP